MIGRSAGTTDTGRRRRRNEDAFVCRPPLFAIADGMGGAQAGEVASRLAAAVVDESSEAGEAGEARVAELIQEANRRVYARSREDAAASGMGTTMTVALVEAGGRIAVGHVGDSRAYRIRDGELEQLTEDHSLVGELMRSGKLSPEEAEIHPQRSVITRALGTDPDVDVDTFTVESQPGDLYLLCSDGLTSMVSDDDILGLIEERRGDLDRAVKDLVRAANRGGGEDNITVIVFEIVASGEETVQMPAARPEEDGEVPEDTLTELDRVPAVDTMVIPAEEVEHHAPAPARDAGRASQVLAIVALLAALALVSTLVVWGLLR